MKLTKQKGKKIGIIGLGITGLSVFNALEDVASTIILWDDSEINRNKIQQSYGEKLIKALSDTAWKSLDMIVFSPGVPPSHEGFRFAKEYNIRISSDIELFLEETAGAKIIAITGTNGKSTTTALIGHILQSYNLNYQIGGNIGLEVLMLDPSAEGYVLELSSFQLDLLPELKADVSVLLNILPNHLDRYGNLEAYAHSKSKIITSKGINIIGIDTKFSHEQYLACKNLGLKIAAVTTEEKLPDIDKGVICHQEHLYDNYFDHNSSKLPKNLSLQGRHNNENIAAAYAAARAIGVPADSIWKAVETFQGLKHRMQYLGTKNNIIYLNDSKATNTASAFASLYCMKNVFWLAGGVFKEENLEYLMPVIQNISKAYLFGQSKELFAEFLQNMVPYELCNDLPGAFRLAQNDAQLVQLAQESEQGASEPGVILLAPACASYDQFRNFEERGDIFIKLYEESQ